MNFSGKPIWLGLFCIGCIGWIIVIWQSIYARIDTIILKPKSEILIKPNCTQIKNDTTLNLLKFDTSFNGSIQSEERNDKHSNQVTSNRTECININSANREELTSINGIGLKLAERIVTFRQKNGNFTQAKDLIKVKGIGEGKVKKIIDNICF